MGVITFPRKIEFYPLGKGVYLGKMRGSEGGGMFMRVFLVLKIYKSLG